MMQKVLYNSSFDNYNKTKNFEGNHVIRGVYVNKLVFRIIKIFTIYISMNSMNSMNNNHNSSKIPVQLFLKYKYVPISLFVIIFVTTES